MSGEKFAEPRGWALKWVFSRRPVPPPTENVEESSRGVGRKFPEPRGWAAQWDGSALSEPEEEQET
jgi:hypothetical protein